jgi:UDP-N-acetyl-D-galactosamine dehydrogenase
MNRIEDLKLGVIGLGYVGLPLAVSFGKKFDVVGFDISQSRIEELKQGHDRTLEITKEELLTAGNLKFTGSGEDLASVNFFICTVPTPVNEHNYPDLSPVYNACKTIGRYLKKQDIVVFESTVYPGVTEEECVPILEKESGLLFNTDFFCGYSPERINPGDKEHTFEKILKVTAGSTPESAELINNVYKTVVKAGTYMASSIKVAEAAKVIENTQRDINIAFINELSKIFNLMGIDTNEVLAAAGTKWNFLPFKPGLVGGHCIGVDPYYLAHKAQTFGYHPEMILVGRRLNDGMSKYIASEIIKGIVCAGHNIKNEKVLVMGVTFKENCPDTRNSKVVDLIKELQSYNLQVDVQDEWADSRSVEHEYGFSLVEKPDLDSGFYKAVILAVAHNEYKALDWEKIRKHVAFIYDLKGLIPKHLIDKRL